MVAGKPAGEPKKPRQGAKKKAETEAAEGNGGAEIGHNSKPAPVELSDDQRAALFWQHKNEYEQALAVKKAGDAEFKNACRRIKAEGGSDQIAAIKDAILLETPEGEETIREEIARKQRVAKWMATALGTQLTLWEPAEDRTPAVDRAAAEGRRDGLKGKPRQSTYAPGCPQDQSYLAGWSEGQAVLMKGGFRPLPPEEPVGSEPIEPAAPTSGAVNLDDVRRQRDADRIGTEDPSHTIKH